MPWPTLTETQAQIVKGSLKGAVRGGAVGATASIASGAAVVDHRPGLAALDWRIAAGRGGHDGGLVRRRLRRWRPHRRNLGLYPSQTAGPQFRNTFGQIERAKPNMT